MAEPQTVRVANIAPLVALSRVTQGANAIANAPFGRQIDIPVACGVEAIENLTIDFVRDASEEETKPDDLTNTERRLFRLWLAFTPFPSSTTTAKGISRFLLAVCHGIGIDLPVFVTSCLDLLFGHNFGNVSTAGRRLELHTAWRRDEEPIVYDENLLIIHSVDVMGPGASEQRAGEDARTL